MLNHDSYIQLKLLVKSGRPDGPAPATSVGATNNWDRKDSARPNPQAGRPRYDIHEEDFLADFVANVTEVGIGQGWPFIARRKRSAAHRTSLQNRGTGGKSKKPRWSWASNQMENPGLLMKNFLKTTILMTVFFTVGAVLHAQPVFANLYNCQRRNRMDSKPAVENGSYSGGFSSKDSLKILIPSSVF